MSGFPSGSVMMKIQSFLLVWLKWSRLKDLYHLCCFLTTYCKFSLSRCCLFIWFKEKRLMREIRLIDIIIFLFLDLQKSANICAPKITFYFIIFIPSIKGGCESVIRNVFWNKINPFKLWWKIKKKKKKVWFGVFLNWSNCNMMLVNYEETTVRVTATV